MLTVDDLALFQEVRLEALHDSPASFGASPDNDGCLDDVVMRDRLAHSVNRHYGAFDGSHRLVSIAGFVRPDAGKRMHIGAVYGVYTRPEARRRGVARLVMDAILSYARGLDGLEALQLSVSSEAPGAQALYESVGFKAWGTEPRALRIGDRRPDEIHLAMDLLAYR